VDSAAQPIGSGLDLCLIPDLRSFSLKELAKRAADGENAVTGVLSRIVDDPENPPRLQATMFNSAI
jgi:hypothetical protein